MRGEASGKVKGYFLGKVWVGGFEGRRKYADTDTDTDADADTTFCRCFLLSLGFGDWAAVCMAAISMWWYAMPCHVMLSPVLSCQQLGYLKGFGFGWSVCFAFLLDTAGWLGAGDTQARSSCMSSLDVCTYCTCPREASKQAIHPSSTLIPAAQSNLIQPYRPSPPENPPKPRKTGCAIRTFSLAQPPIPSPKTPNLQTQDHTIGPEPRERKSKTIEGTED